MLYTLKLLIPVIGVYDRGFRNPVLANWLIINRHFVRSVQVRGA
jgi:hypothetical protein